jgi:cell division transport system permease protein
MSRFYKRRISYLPTFFSISLVLFLAGLLGYFIMNANAMKSSIKENVELSLYFNDNISEADILKTRDKLQAEPYVKKADYISKEDGVKIWPLGAEGVKLLGFNPIPNSIDVHFNSGFVVFDSLKSLKIALQKNPGIRDVQFDEDVVENIDKYVQTAGIVLISLALMMGLVSIALINSAIRLNMYSRRFLIKSMQLVGATKNFIRRPIINTGIITGLCSAAFAAVLLTGFIYFIKHKFGFLFMLDNYIQIGALLLGMILMGILITGLSSYFAINKYLKLKLDDLF